MLLVTPLSVWIGFTWREVFKSSLMTITGYIHYFPLPLEQGIFAVIVVSAVLPTWRKYVLTQEHILRKAMIEATVCSNPACKNVFVDDAKYCRMCGAPRQGAGINYLHGAASKSAVRFADDKVNGLGQPLVGNGHIHSHWKQVEDTLRLTHGYVPPHYAADPYSVLPAQNGRTSPYSPRQLSPSSRQLAFSSMQQHVQPSLAGQTLVAPVAIDEVQRRYLRGNEGVPSYGYRQPQMYARTLQADNSMAGYSRAAG